MFIINFNIVWLINKVFTIINEIKHIFLNLSFNLVLIQIINFKIFLIFFLSNFNCFLFFEICTNVFMSLVLIINKIIFINYNFTNKIYLISDFKIK